MTITKAQNRRYREKFYDFCSKADNLPIINKLLTDPGFTQELHPLCIYVGCFAASQHGHEKILITLLDFMQKNQVVFLPARISACFNVACTNYHENIALLLDKRFDIVANAAEEKRAQMTDTNGKLKLLVNQEVFDLEKVKNVFKGMAAPTTDVAHENAPPIASLPLVESMAMHFFMVDKQIPSYEMNPFVYQCKERNYRLLAKLLDQAPLIDGSLIENLFIRACNLQHLDMVELLASNPKTKAIVATLEGIQAYLNEPTQNAQTKTVIKSLLHSLQLHHDLPIKESSISKNKV